MKTKDGIEITWEDAILNVMYGMGGNNIKLSNIYMKIEELLDLDENNLKITYHRHNFEHSVRSILNTLRSKGKVERVRLGSYSLI